MPTSKGSVKKMTSPGGEGVFRFMKHMARNRALNRKNQLTIRGGLRSSVDRGRGAENKPSVSMRGAHPRKGLDSSRKVSGPRKGNAKTQSQPRLPLDVKRGKRCFFSRERKPRRPQKKRDQGKKNAAPRGGLGRKGNARLEEESTYQKGAKKNHYLKATGGCARLDPRN